LEPFIYYAIGIFIANFHCGAAVPLTITLLLLIAIDVFLSFCFDESIPKSFISQLISTSLFIIGLCFNPYGLKQVVNMFSVMSLKSTSNISEWKPFQSNSYVTWVFLFLIAYSFGYALRKKIKSNERNDLRTICVLSAFLVLACVSGKAFIMFYYLWIIYGAVYLSEMIYDVGVCMNFKKEWFIEKLEYDFTKPLFRSKLPSIFILLFMILFATISFTIDKTSMCNFIQQSSTQYIDGETIDYLNANVPNDAKLLHGYSTGNYLLASDISVFIDTRQQPYCAEFGWSTALDDYFDTNIYDIFWWQSI
jgi:hypothetical protein